MFLDKSPIRASRYTWILAAANVSCSEKFLAEFVIKETSWNLKDWL